MELSGLSVAVIGGGIGGMAAAAALAQRGAQVRLYEQAPELSEVGAGLQISANGQVVLRALQAVGQDIPTQATLSPGTHMRAGRSGRKVAFVPPPSSGATWYMHRADLLTLLIKSAERAGVEITLGRPVTPGTVRADLIVAADGGQSTWRSVVDGPVAPAFTGQVAWRALVPCDPPVAADQPATLAMGSRAHVVSYPLRSGRSMNIVAVEERSGWTQEGWRQSGDPADFRARFADFGGATGALIARAEAVHLWALHLRPVARRWADGRVALLGDAAHPTVPFMAQGACLALEDAWVLSSALAHAGGVEAGLVAYQHARRARAEAVVALARGNAWRFHLTPPWSWGARAVLAFGAGALARRLDWVYGYDATKVFT
ncbi:FAD-dependent monooxygenase [Aestuariivita sp.]|jgi:salicylate hydroxylase|uniref:FAD-dependent monooxygenase n=1 Tax=Aestuariivita sp. TaxID=1872407 RepID=UPI0021720518|nr:FAD-dependent monooxygenase [Aestuariivita sp.]MCE8009259.1 NAD(P)-binding protein [Aestuariivita sp.]